MPYTLTRQIASSWARIALGHLTREYPNKLDHVMTGGADVRSPRELHPIFFGSFDWHSCVHGHWLLARVYRRFPDLPEALQIRALFDEQFTAGKVGGELAYLARAESRAFERPYGWAWALMLHSELLRHSSAHGRRWAESMLPLAEAFALRFKSYLPLATYPVRVGAHANSAFALLLAREYAASSGDAQLSALCDASARRWYGADRDCPAWEPSQDEFLSPALIEAALMRAVLPADEFAQWFHAFLPNAPRGLPATLFEPATVSDRSDGKIAHLDGLNLSRAWCWRVILDGLSGAAALQGRVQSAIEAHLASAIDQVAGDYMGEHWLASFALLSLDPDPA